VKSLLGTGHLTPHNLTSAPAVANATVTEAEGLRKRNGQGIAAFAKTIVASWYHFVNLVLSFARRVKMTRDDDA
jgi:hypothetical protein